MQPCMRELCPSGPAKGQEGGSKRVSQLAKRRNKPPTIRTIAIIGSAATHSTAAIPATTPIMPPTTPTTTPPSPRRRRQRHRRFRRLTQIRLRQNQQQKKNAEEYYERSHGITLRQTTMRGKRKAFCYPSTTQSPRQSCRARKLYGRRTFHCPTRLSQVDEGGCSISSVFTVRAGLDPAKPDCDLPVIDRLIVGSSGICRTSRCQDPTKR